MEADFYKARLQEEATCPICLAYFIDPVLLDCGHNFCRVCINQCWMEFPSNTTCPQCRKAIATKTCRPNRALVNVIEILKQLGNKDERVDKICKKHPEASKIVFCKEDQVILCLVCEICDHRGHQLLPLKEAAQEYKNRYCSWTQVLLQEKKEILAHKIKSIRENEELMKRTETEKQRTLTEFRQLRQFVDDQESFWLATIQAVTRDLGNKRNEQLCKLSADLFTLQHILKKLEEKCLQPDVKLLQDVGKTLEKYEKRPKFKPPEGVPIELKWRTWELHELNALLEGAAKQFKTTLQGGYQPHAVNLYFDPESAHPQLLMSCDGKSVCWTQVMHDVPPTQKRFDRHFCVMGHQEFTDGRHFWEVVVRGKENWALGVAKSSVDRKGTSHFSSEAGFFAMGRGPRLDGTSHISEQTEELKKIRVSLNCPGGQVVFYDANKAQKIFSFNNASFHRETLLPFFWVKGDSQISLCTN